MSSVVVIGAGVIGCAIADALAVRGADVAVLDIRSPGRGASQASAGVLAPYIEADEDNPLLSLGVRSLNLFDGFISGVRERSGLPIEYSKTGTLDIALSDADVERLSASRAWLARTGVAHEWIDAAHLAAFESAVSPSARGALFIPGHKFVGVASLIKALALGARFSGARFEWPVEVARVDPKSDRVLVSAGERRYEADFAVVAGGSWSGRVRVGGMKHFGVRPIRGQLLHLTWPAKTAVPARVVWGPRCYTVPWSDGSLLVGATVEDVGFDERSTVDGVRGLLDAVSELLPASRGASLEQVRVGLRPAAADGLPLIGPLESAPNVIIATGHYRNGILLAPLTADIVARCILDRETDDAIAVTTPARPGAAIEKRSRPARKPPHDS